MCSSFDFLSPSYFVQEQCIKLMAPNPNNLEIVLRGHGVHVLEFDVLFWMSGLCFAKLYRQPCAQFSWSLSIWPIYIREPSQPRYYKAALEQVCPDSSCWWVMHSSLPPPRWMWTNCRAWCQKCKLTGSTDKRAVSEIPLSCTLKLKTTVG